MTRRNSTKIAFWSCNGITNKKTELQVFMQEQDIDVMLLNETHLKPSENLIIPNYTVHRTDRKINQEGGTAAVVKQSLLHNQLPQPDQERIETTGIQIQTAQGPINVYSTYIPPGHNFPEDEMNKITNGNSPTIIAGDLNSKHPQ